MTPSENDDEKRKFFRIPKKISIEYSKLTFAPDPGGATEGVGKNLGRGGICITVSRPFESGTMLNLKLNIMGWGKYKKPFSKMVDISGDNHLTAIGKVVWREKLTEEEGWDLGIQFVDIYEDDYRALMRYLDDSGPPTRGAREKEGK